MSEHTVTINGVAYDKHSGLPIHKTPPAATHTTPAGSKQHSAQHAHAIHSHVQKSKTLNRHYVRPSASSTAKKSAATETVKVVAKPAAPAAASTHAITRFAKHPVDITVKQSRPQPRRVVADIAPTVHPMVQRVTAAKAATSAPTVPKPSHVIKQEAIEKSLSESTPAKSRRHREKAAKHSTKALHGRALKFASAGAALFLIAGYFTYLNMPNLSVRVAAAQAGIDASYPSYHPSGYSLAGPVAFDDGQVSMKFAMNGSNQNFTLTQVKSGWDSSAVQNNYVIPAAGSDYTVTQANGLTIYTYGNDAVWVNGNILYTIKGDASLTADQIQRIATSM